MKFIDQFKTAAKRALAADYPSHMRSMCFSESVTGPYTLTTTREAEFLGYSRGARCYNITDYNPPKVQEKNYPAERLKWLEAEKVEGAEGPRYRLTLMTEVKPGLHKKSDIEKQPVTEHTGRSLFTKQEALSRLSIYDRLYSDHKHIKRDGMHTRQYFGTYLPEDEAGNIYTPKAPGIFKI